MALTDTIALTTLATLLDELGLSGSSYDTRLERYVLQVSEAAAKYCDRPFRKTTYTEKLRGTQTARLVLPVRPIVSITSIVIDGTTLDSGEYSIEDAEAGIIYRAGGWLRFDNVVPWSVARDPIAGTAKRDIVVTYIGGYVLPNDATGTRNLPYDVEQACIMGVVSAFRQRGQDRNVSSKATGDASISYRNPNTIVGVESIGTLPTEALALLNAYKQEPMVS